jgi:hypothetical protein
MRSLDPKRNGNERSYSFGVLAFALFVVCASVFGQDTRVLNTQLRTLVTHPDQFHRKRVRLRAQMVSSTHGAALLDSACGPQGIVLRIAEEARDNADFKALDDALRQGTLGTAGKRVVGTFTGQFLWHPGSTSGKRILAADKLGNLEVKMAASH